MSQLSGEQLSHIIFPIGKLRKTKVRELAKKFKLHTATKKDSQGLCFIGQEINVKDFIKKHLQLPNTEGDILNVYNKKIGTHQGAIFYTIGERHRFEIDPKYQTPNMPRLFVISKDVEKNTITIGTQQELQQQSKTSILLTRLNWINKAPKDGKIYTCRIRHRGELYKCKIKLISNKNKAEIAFKNKHPSAVASGQFAAIYNGDEC